MKERDELMEKIALGKCVSPMTVDRCPYCVDVCRASAAIKRINNMLNSTGVTIKK